MYDVVIRGGVIVDPESNHLLPADIGIAEGKIAALARSIGESGKTEIDATGLHVFPGGIDPHVHFNEPGRTEWEGFATGTRALAAGGVTTCFDMPLNSNPPVVNVEALELKRVAAKQSAVVNVEFWGGLIPGNLGELEKLHRAGVVGFKAFMSNSGIAEFPAVDDYTLLEGMKFAAELRAIVAVHAENDAITSGLARDAIAAGRTSVCDYLDSRPSVAEWEAIQRAILFAKGTGCRLHIVHVSSARGVDLVSEAQSRGVDVTCETCPHYLVLTDEDVERLGAVAKCAPPIRDSQQQGNLWRLLRTGHIPIVASDHSPAPMDMKQGGNFFAIWGGIAGCQSTLPLLLSEGHAKRHMPLHQIAAVTSANAAERFGLSNKGRIAAGMDADLALVETSSPWTLRAEDLQYKHKVSPYVGMEMTGRVVRTLVAGKTVFDLTPDLRRTQ